MGQPLLIEIGTEEIPASYLGQGASQLQLAVETILDSSRIDHDIVRSTSSPRRLIVWCDEMNSRGKDTQEIATGPKKEKAFDSHGNPTEAAIGFAKSKGVDLADLFLMNKGKGEVLATKVSLLGLPSMDVLADSLPLVGTEMSFPKSMRWHTGRFRFARPVRWLLALLGEEIISYEAYGLISSRITYGHRFISTAPIHIRTGRFEEYRDRLAEEGVLIPREIRKASILRQLKSFLPDRSELDMPLLETVTDLVECPHVIQGHFHERYLQLPDDILITAMRHHQKVFSMVDENGLLLPSFLTVANASPEAAENIRGGHERVVQARLEDAMFFWQEDNKITLEQHAERLQEIVAQIELGTYSQKAARLEKLVRWCCFQLNSGSGTLTNLCLAARLCKADLVTQMVGEFPELQGIVGSIYAEREGLAKPICQAIREHYKPWGQDDDIPGSVEGALLSVCDKIDTLAGCFRAGLAPSGSGDPWGLRRAAIGLTRSLLGHGIPLSLASLSEASLKIFMEQSVSAQEHETDTKSCLLEFLMERVKHLFREEGVRRDLVDAATGASVEDIPSWHLRAQALAKLQNTEGFQDTAMVFRRVANIIAQARHQGECFDQEPSPERFEKQSEHDLWKAFLDTRTMMRSLLEKKDLDGSLKWMISLKPNIDHFFDEVMVMTDDSSIRRNRLCLIHTIERQFREVADFSQLKGQ